MIDPWEGLEALHQCKLGQRSKKPPKYLLSSLDKDQSVGV